MTDTPHRVVEVPAQRLRGWVARFAERHGGGQFGLTVLTDLTSVTLQAPDGAVAALEVGFGPVPEWPADPLALLEQRAGLADDSVLVLVRRGGWAVGLARDGHLLSHRNGTKYVQGRTAAGGWSQQRFARRRAGQTQALATVVSTALSHLLADVPLSGDAAPRVLVVGGDRALVWEVVAPVTRVAELPRSVLFDVPDPRLATLGQTLRRAQCIRVRLNDRA